MTQAAYDDTPIRQRIGPWSPDGAPDLDAFDPDTNYFVRAAAGSGKTTSLVARMVALVRQGVAPEHLAAITFTRKAAGEMTTRFFAELERTRDALDRDAAPAEWAAVDTGLRQAQRAFIGTIHAFCGRILRERPLAVGLPPRFTAGLDDRDERALRERAWHAHLQAMQQDTDRIDRLVDLGVEPDDLKPYFNTLCTHPELEPYTAAPDDVPAMTSAIDAVRALLDRWQPRRPDPPPKGRDAVMKAFDRVEKRLRYNTLAAPAEQAALLNELTGVIKSNGQAKVTLSAWGERGTDAYEAARVLRDEELPALVEHTIEPVLRQWTAYVHRAVVAFTRPAVETYQALRRQEGQLTFHDILRLTRDLLRDRPAVRRRLQDRFRVLLVDEFQDTDPLQAEILFYLTGENVHETDWTACRPRPGSLFIVGDDKQSIYRFRRADMAVFHQVGSLIDAAGGEVVDLTKNFRSLGRLCRWCDDAFSALFAEPALAPYQATYRRFDPQRPDGDDPVGLRRIEVPDVHGNKGRGIARKDAEQIARFIRGAMDGAIAAFEPGGGTGSVFPETPAYSDFMILTRTKSRLTIYAEQLARYGIPYTITGSEDVGASDELKALVDLMTCALRPDDAVAGVAYLKGPLAGLSDDALYRYRQAGGSFDRMHEPPPGDVVEALDAALAERFTAAFARIRRARALLDAKRPAVALEQMVEEFGLLAGAAHPAVPAEGSLRAGYLLRILTAVQHRAAAGLDWAEVLHELQRVVDGDDALDGMTLETGRADAVRVMNVHQAKGLEAPVVFLADPYSAGGRPTITQHVRRATGELVAPVVQGERPYERVTHPPLGWHDDTDEAFRQEEERHAQAEAHRLLYVAATRAENLLVVSTYPKKRGAGYWGALTPFLDEAEVPALPVPALDAHAPSGAPAPRCAAQRTARSERLDTARQPTYATAPVTALAGEGAAPDGQVRPAPSEGYGPDFGAAVHALVERCVRRRAEPLSAAAVPVRDVLTAHLDAAPTAEQLRRARRMIDGLLASDLWREIAAAPVAYPEYPIGRVEAADGETPTLQRGVIDLLYRTDAGWAIVDVKTDRVADAGALDVLQADAAYARQVRLYAAAWRAVAGEPAARVGLWMADVERFVPVL